MTWVTRERPVVDRIAWPWLIEQLVGTEPDPATSPAVVAALAADVSRRHTEEVVPTEAGAHTTAWDARRRLDAPCPASRGALLFEER